MSTEVEPQGEGVVARREPKAPAAAAAGELDGKSSDRPASAGTDAATEPGDGDVQRAGSTAVGRVTVGTAGGDVAGNGERTDGSDGADDGSQAALTAAGAPVPEGADRMAAGTGKVAAPAKINEAAEQPRATVGVVYTPADLPDASPAPHEDIIIGLPKAPDETTAAELDETTATEPDETDVTMVRPRDAQPAAAAGPGAPGDGAPGDGAATADVEARSDGSGEDSQNESSQDGSGDAGLQDVGGQGESAQDTREPVGDEGKVATGEKSATEQAAVVLTTALMRLRSALASSKLPIDVVGADEARQQQKAMLDQLDDYILPRLVQLEAPVLAVVGGSTGAGKSTLVNSLVGHVVSEPGVLRPTTRSPVLVHNPVDSDWFTGDRVFPSLARSTGETPGGNEGAGSIRLVAAGTIPQGLAILDAPDIDSVVEANRELASQLLAAADLWLFITTAARYADAVPWDFLRDAAERSTAVAVVLDRVPPDSIDEVMGHLAQMLLERGLGDSPLFAVPEIEVDADGLLPDEVVAAIKAWLTALAADAEARAAVVRRTLQGAVSAMTKKTPAFAQAVRAQADTLVELRATAETAYERAVRDVHLASQDGTMLRGEVLARWQEFVGTGELLKGLQTNVGRLRDKVRAAVVGKPQPARGLNEAVESGLESLLREHAEAAAERAEESWQSTAAGRQLLAAGDRDLGRASREFPAAASRAVRDWQGHVLELVRSEGADRRSTARVLAYGVNGLGVALMVVIFASTAGITGAEVGVGAGTAVVGQKVLEAVFGDQAVRSLAAKARQDLDGRVRALMDAELARYLTVLDQHPVDPDAPRRLMEAARAVEDCT